MKRIIIIVKEKIENMKLSGKMLLFYIMFAGLLYAVSVLALRG